MAKEREDDGAELLEGRDLRAAAKQLAKGPMKFAFGFQDARNPVLLLHRSRSARALFQELKTTHGATKATHGTASAQDATLVLEVEGASLPGMQRMVKTLLKKEKVGKLTEARVESKAEAGAARQDGQDEGGPDAAATPGELEGQGDGQGEGQAELSALQDEIRSAESVVGKTLQGLGAGGDARPLSRYIELCVELGRRARGCGDAELVEFARTSMTRAKKVAAVLERSAGAAASAAAGGAPGGSRPGALPAGLTVEGGHGDNSGGIKQTADGVEVSFKHERSLPLFAKNFKVWVIPCYTKGGLKASLEATGMIGATAGVKISAKGAGTLELGVGGTSDTITAGPYGSIELSATSSMCVQCSAGASEAPDGWTLEPFTFSVNGTGKVGIKVEVEGGGKLDAAQEVVNWELFVVYVGRYTGGKFESIDVRAGKDLNRLIAALEQAGPRIQQAVERYAPEAVKQAAVDAAEWAAESDTAGAVADTVEQVVQGVKQETGVDVGAGVEELVQSLVDEHGETAAEATRRVNAELETFRASQDGFHAVIGASGLKGELQPFRSALEYNAIVDVWQQESELEIKGQAAPGNWKAMVEKLVAVARQRQSQAKAQASAQKKAAQAVTDAALQAAVQAAVATMEAARPGAQGQGNVLNNRLQATPNANAKPFFDKGWRDWAAAEAARAQVAGLSGEAKAHKAREATAAYERARATFTTGIQHL